MKIDRILNNELELFDIVEWGETGGLGKIVQPTESEVKLTVGQEFVNWAEQYWRLKEHYVEIEEKGSESCPYDYVKNIFIHKIDEIIKKRL